MHHRRFLVFLCSLLLLVSAAGCGAGDPGYSKTEVFAPFLHSREVSVFVSDFYTPPETAAPMTLQELVDSTDRWEFRPTDPVQLASAPEAVIEITAPDGKVLRTEDSFDGFLIYEGDYIIMTIHLPGLEDGDLTAMLLNWAQNMQ